MLFTAPPVWANKQLGPLIDLSPLIDESHKGGVFSIGIGDNGNGFGRIYETVKTVMLYGGKWFLLT